MKKPSNVEDIYELSPFQHGVLFHMLYAPGTGVYIEQLTFTLEGSLDVDAFRKAWEHVVGRHPILRTSFHWKEITKPIQVVHKDARFKLEQHDWRGLNEDEQA